MNALSLPATIYTELVQHLAATDVEQVAFLFTDPATDRSQLRVIESYCVPDAGFVIHSDRHVSLKDDVRAHVIKRAWDLGGCLIEVHSHCGQAPPAFSRSDLLGFEEWVPHVRWRLRDRPYVALVFTGRDFDALVWEGPDGAPSRLASLAVDGSQDRAPSGITYERLSKARA
jgi:hypothetical protein